MDSLDDEPLPRRDRARMDETPDALFYAIPRLVTHIDDRAIAAVGALYAELGLDGDVLDLMSSWVSHFREPPGRLVGLGMNEVELRANPMLDDWAVHDLNRDPVLPFPDAAFDAVTCCVSIDYLTRPAAVVRDIGRVLRPGGILVVTFSNRCFPTKAISAWLTRDDAGRVALVEDHVRAAPDFAPPESRELIPDGRGTDPLWAVLARRRPV